MNKVNDKFKSCFEGCVVRVLDIRVFIKRLKFFIVFEGICFFMVIGFRVLIFIMIFFGI